MIEQKWLNYRLHLFSEVVRLGSFTAAAEHLGHTRSGVSQHIAQLEQQLGVQLLSRSTRTLNLTNQGEKLLKRVRQMDDILSTALQEIQENEQQPQGNIRITAPHAFESRIVVPAICRLLETFPGLSPELIIDDQRLDLIKQQIDLAIRVGEQEDSSLKASKLGSLREVLVASPGFCIKHAVKSPQQLEQLPFIATDWQRQLKKLTFENSRETAQPKQICVTNTLSSAVELCVQGLGYALLPDIYVQPMINSGQLHPFSDFRSNSQHPIYAVHSFQRNTPLQIRRLIELLRNQFNY